MEKKNESRQPQQKGKHEHPLPGEIPNKEWKQNIAAHREAEKDMDDDAEFTAQNPNDDLDEGESARLGEDIPGII